MTDEREMVNHCLYAEELVQRGEVGRIQLLRGAHYQDMENWPPYWLGLPPMHYATHAIAPLLKLARTRAMHVLRPWPAARA